MVALQTSRLMVRWVRMARPKYTPNPFYFGDLALDEAFTDRLEELKSLESDMQNGRNVALIAPRRCSRRGRRR